MYFKVLKGTTLFNQLLLVKSQMKVAKEAAHQFLERIGYKIYLEKTFCLAGGIEGIEIKGKPPKDWKKVWPQHYDNVYMPMEKRVSTKDLYKEIRMLPTVPYSAINSVLLYSKEMSREGNKVSFHPGFSFEDNCVLLDFNNRCAGCYKPLEEMIEITYSEYSELKGEDS